jgi:hypothetical protein
MPTYNDRGFPLYSDSEAMPAWHTAYNAQSNLLATAMDTSDAANQADDKVATIGALPVTGNWVGRQIYVEEDNSLRTCVALPGSWVITGWARGSAVQYLTWTGAALDAPVVHNPLVTTDFVNSTDTSIVTATPTTAGMLVNEVGVYAVRMNLTLPVAVSVAGFAQIGSDGDLDWERSYLGVGDFNFSVACEVNVTNTADPIELKFLKQNGSLADNFVRVAIRRIF